MPWNGGLSEPREGLLIYLQGGQGQFGWGEVAPLPGFSQESLAEAEAELREKLPFLINDINLPLDTCFASVAFGLSCALSSLNGKASLNGEVSLNGKVSLSAWMPDTYQLLSLDQLPKKIDELTASDRKFGVKVKLNPASMKSAISQLNDCYQRCEGQIVFRLDANRSLSLSQAFELLASLPLSAIYYLEEPLSNPDELSNLYASSLVPLALDESLQQATYIQGVESLAGIKAFVVKPMLCGGLDRLARLARYASIHQIELVISSVYEGAIAWSQLCSLARYYAPNLPAGLDTRKVFVDAEKYSKVVRIGQWT